MHTKTSGLTVIFSVLGAIILLLISLPILAMVGKESPASIAQVSQDAAVRGAIWLSVSTALYSTLIALLFGVPLGYILARKEFFGKSVLQGIVDVPVVVPHTVAGIALLTVFGARGLLGAPFEMLGLRFVDAVPGIVVAMLFVSAPFVINSARDGFQSVDKRLENVARSLGASEFGAFFDISLPLASRSILTGAILSWARAISEFGAVIILVYYPMIAPTLIYDRFTSFGLNASRPIAVLLILICLVVFVAMKFAARKK